MPVMASLASPLVIEQAPKNGRVAYNGNERSQSGPFPQSNRKPDGFVAEIQSWRSTLWDWLVVAYAFPKSEALRDVSKALTSALVGLSE